MLVATGYWPTHIEFGLDDLATVTDVLNKDRQPR